MNPIVSLDSISKSFGSKFLFENLSLGIHSGEKTGVLGVNGAGKSTLLKIICGLEQPDSGDVHTKRNLRSVYVAQSEEFDESLTVIQQATSHLIKHGIDESEASIQAAIYLGMAGFEDQELLVKTLSGGWKKRLSLSQAFARDPDLLILDEPTNHLDWDGIFWLESYLNSFDGSLLLVSHDRQFLQNLTTRTIEIHRAYEKGILAFDCKYEDFLPRKEEYLDAQMNLQSSLSNKARREVEWLRAGVKARTTKSRSRIKKAHKLIDTLGDVKSRNKAAGERSVITIDATQRLSKKLIDLKGVCLSFGDTNLIKDLNMTLGPKTCLGVLGENGSGKTSFLKLILEELNPNSGTLYKADHLKIVYFDQKREDLPQDQNLMQYLGDGADHTLFRDQSIHVAAYASRFLFPSEKMQLPISQLSGGEQARLLIAKVLLNPADVFILDEPTNDLDIETIEVLESTLSEFDGLTILVSHDRYFLSHLCDSYLGLNGNGNWALYAEVDQWIKRETSPNIPIQQVNNPTEPPPTKKAKKLSYKEKQQLKTIEQDIQNLELELKQTEKRLESPEVLSDHQALAETAEKASSLQKSIDELYELWSILEDKKKGES